MSMTAISGMQTYQVETVRVGVYDCHFRHANLSGRNSKGVVSMTAISGMQTYQVETVKVWCL